MSLSYFFLSSFRMPVGRYSTLDFGNVEDDYEKIAYEVKSKIDPDYVAKNYIGDYLVTIEDGTDFGYSYFQKHGFSRPIRFINSKGLKMRIPSSQFTIDDVKKLVGSKRELDIFEVQTQSAVKISMKNFAEYFKKVERRTETDILYNLISLEFSYTRLDDYVQAPHFIPELDWTDLAWFPDSKEVTFDSNNNVSNFNYPKVQKYMLASVPESYTDFHLDFGGSSVWYHLHKGEKIFWVAPPTPKNLETYRKWAVSKNQHKTFLGDLLKDSPLQLVRLQAGDTLLIPGGYIHAVYTTKQSLVFGGNFLNSFNIEVQNNIVKFEDIIHTSKNYLFPYYDDLLW